MDRRVRLLHYLGRLYPTAHPVPHSCMRLATGHIWPGHTMPRPGPLPQESVCEASRDLEGTPRLGESRVIRIDQSWIHDHGCPSGSSGPVLACTPDMKQDLLAQNPVLEIDSEISVSSFRLRSVRSWSCPSFYVERVLRAVLNISLTARSNPAVWVPQAG